jgi:diguanylate cyclase (GGDEF)-like protein
LEKRKFTRQASEIAGVLILGTRGRLDCVISDFSQDGMLVTFGEAASVGLSDELLAETHGAARLSFALPDRQIELEVMVVHRSGLSMGLQLTHHRPQFLWEIQQAARASNGAADSPRIRAMPVGLDQPRRASLMAEANRVMSAYLEPRLDELFEMLPGELLEVAEQQGNQGQQQPFFDTIALVRAHRKNLPATIVSRLRQDSQGVSQGRLAQDPHSGSAPNDRHTLSLVEKNEFEDWLTIRKCISRAEISQRETLLEFQFRLDAAFGSLESPRCYNPFAPGALCYAFCEAAKPLRLSGDVLGVALRLFHDRVLVDLRSLYDELTQLFIAAGVLPDLDVAKALSAQALKPRRTAPSTVMPQQIGSAAPGKASRSADSTHHTPPAPAGPNLHRAANGDPGTIDPGLGPKQASKAYSTATRLWSLHKRVAVGEAIDPQGLAEAEQPEPIFDEASLDALLQLQQQVLQGQMQLASPGTLREQLAQSAERQIPLSDYERDSADMIENLFDNIVSQEGLVEDLREEVRKLEVPLLRVMLKDPALFTADFHPARQAINHIALLSDRNSLHAGTHRKSIIKAIATILESSDDEGFNKALLMLDQLVAKEKRLVDRNLLRLSEACEGQHRIRQATRLLEIELNKRLVSPPVPEPVIALIEHGWKDLMMLCLFREGEDSQPWDLTLEIIDQLVARLVPGAPPRENGLLKIDALLRLINKGLSKVHDSEGAQTPVLARLEQLLRGELEDVPLCSYRSPVDSLQAEPTPADDFDVPGVAPRWLKRARVLKPGQWLESRKPNEPAELMNLAWIANDFSHFALANRQGLKVAELSLVQIARGLQDGTLAICDEGSLPAIEQGLDTLVQKIYEKLAFDASHDQLTGLRTRKEFTQSLIRSVTQAQEQALKYTLIFIDLLQFKLINNTCGYEAGDRLLGETAQRLKNLAGPDAVVGRIGAAEFAILVPLDSEQEGYLLAADVKTDIEQRRFEEADQSFVINTAMALLGFDQHNERVMELLRSVESAAEIAKKSGNKEIQVVKPGDARLEQRDEVMSWVTRINRALDNNNLKIRCQQIAPLGTDPDAQIHYEVLLTVLDEQGLHLAPGEFIKAAEEYNRMGAVDRWVVDAVLHWMHDNPDTLAQFGGFSVNLSGHSLNDESFLDFMFEALVRYQIPRDKLIFEITETVAVANLADAADFITEMRGIGCRFSLDDFGVGQSSFSYLKRLPVDFIKIDGSFISNIADDVVDYALVKSITEMGHFLDKKVIAEYVSDSRILETVRDIGLDYAQGFHLGEQVMITDLPGLYGTL